LPDGKFEYQKSHLGLFLGIWNGKCCYNFANILWPFGIFYEHLVHILTIWYILWSFGVFLAIWNTFPVFGILCQEKSGNPGPKLS
jgi:hypothetical protein